MTQPAKNPWIAFRKPRPHARLRLFCFPYAGGGASIYRTWQDSFPTEIEVCPVQPPGRENRLTDERFYRVGPLAEATAEAIEPLLDLPFAFFGYSLGSIVAFETARVLRDHKKRQPVHLFAAARRAPSAPQEDPIYDLPEEEFRSRLVELDGTPTAVLEHPELMELMEPLLRADFELNDTYDLVPGEPLDCPVTAMGGMEDEDVTRDDLDQWREVTSGRFRLRMFAGGHFFIQEHQATLIAAVAQELMPLVPGR